MTQRELTLFAHRGLAVSLACLLALSTAWPARGQQVNTVQGAQESPQQPTQLFIVFGRTARQMIVGIQPGRGRPFVARRVPLQVQDERGRPVKGATVTFTLPGGGPSGLFLASNSTIEIATTDDEGGAKVPGFEPNRTAGEFYMTIRATDQNAKPDEKRLKFVNPKLLPIISRKKLTFLAIPPLVWCFIAGPCNPDGNGPRTTISVTGGTVGPPK